MRIYTLLHWFASVLYPEKPFNGQINCTDCLSIPVFHECCLDFSKAIELSTSVPELSRTRQVRDDSGAWTPKYNTFNRMGYDSHHCTNKKKKTKTDVFLDSWHTGYPSNCNMGRKYGFGFGLYTVCSLHHSGASFLEPSLFNRTEETDDQSLNNKSRTLMHVPIKYRSNTRKAPYTRRVIMP